jgi:hypothetical protein
MRSEKRVRLEKRSRRTSEKHLRVPPLERDRETERKRRQSERREEKCGCPTSLKLSRKLLHCASIFQLFSLFCVQQLHFLNFSLLLLLPLFEK